MKVLDNPFAITSEILNIIKDSRDFLYIVSPYTQFERSWSTELTLIKDAIVDALKRDIDVNLVTRHPEEENVNLKKKLGFMYEEGCKIYLVPKLHSKIYCNESTVLITSMNLFLASILNNKEIGILLSDEIETSEFGQIISYVKDLTKESIS